MKEKKISHLGGTRLFLVHWNLSQPVSLERTAPSPETRQGSWPLKAWPGPDAKAQLYRKSLGGGQGVQTCRQDEESWPGMRLSPSLTWSIPGSRMDHVPLRPFPMNLSGNNVLQSVTGLSPCQYLERSRALVLA